VTARRRGQRVAADETGPVPLSKAVERPKMPVLSLRIIAMSGEMAANIIATPVGPNLAPVWLGHRLSSCGQHFWLRGQTSSKTRGAKRFASV
jgi:hypothetical protein